MPFPVLCKVAASWGRVDWTVSPSRYGNPGTAMMRRKVRTALTVYAKATSVSPLVGAQARCSPSTVVLKSAPTYSTAKRAWTVLSISFL